jgi:hypothetical protein
MNLLSHRKLQVASVQPISRINKPQMVMPTLIEPRYGYRSLDGKPYAPTFREIISDAKQLFDKECLGLSGLGEAAKVSK